MTKMRTKSGVSEQLDNAKAGMVHANVVLDSWNLRPAETSNVKQGRSGMRGCHRQAAPPFSVFSALWVAYSLKCLMDERTAAAGAARIWRK